VKSNIDKIKDKINTKQLLFIEKSKIKGIRVKLILIKYL